MLMPPDFHSLLTQPEYYLSELHLESAECTFIRISRDAVKRSAFMDQRISTTDGIPFRVSLAAIHQAIRHARTGYDSMPVNYILHTGFCCSTLLSRCLDIERCAWALREPWVLTQLAQYKRASGDHPIARNERLGLLSMVLFLLAKPWGAGEILSIKPTNSANNLAEDLIGQPRTGGILLLYSSLQQFLVSILKKGERGRIFVRRLFDAIRTDSARTVSLPPAHLMRLTDLQIVAFVWYQQMDQFLYLVDQFPQAKIHTLDCDTFLTNPGRTLSKLFELFAIKAPPAALQQILAGPDFHKNAKNEKQDYDSAVRKAQYQQVSRQYAEDLASVISWSRGIRPEGPVLLPLPRAL